MEKELKNTVLLFIKNVLFDVFSISFLFIMLFMVSEMLKKGFVSNYLNINGMFVLALVSGMVSVLIPVKKEEKKEGGLFIFWSVFLGSILSFILFINSSGLGIWQYIISAIFILVYGYFVYVIKKEVQ